MWNIIYFAKCFPFTNMDSSTIGERSKALVVNWWCKLLMPQQTLCAGDWWDYKEIEIVYKLNRCSQVCVALQCMQL